MTLCTPRLSNEDLSKSGLNEPTCSNLWSLGSNKSKKSLFLTHVNAVHNQYQLKNIDNQNDTNINLNLLSYIEYTNAVSHGQFGII